MIHTSDKTPAAPRSGVVPTLSRHPSVPCTRVFIQLCRCEFREAGKPAHSLFARKFRLLVRQGSLEFNLDSSIELPSRRLNSSDKPAGKGGTARGEGEGPQNPD